MAPAGLRFVLVTATLPQHTLARVRQNFPDIALAMGPGLHRTSPGLEEELVDCSGGDEITLEAGTQRKLEALTTVSRAWVRVDGEKEETVVTRVKNDQLSDGV